ncbi:hypothetical protein FA13DRAFT_1731411 [Coprinellus micaceus]|uniref:Uncharacterized protein n=1 Tax=Coprinellus micaceus TaxID=71717 RepID=A0A4Y7TFW0_COPMI|nr:hypothetical protein FA13DRAFT_1731411 [Coprinellus micaceus]
MALAADRGQRFTMGEYTLAMRPRDGVNREYFESIYHHTPRIIRPYLKQALAVRRRLSDRRKVEMIMEYWLAPWMAKVDRAMGLAGIHAEGPAMRTHTVYLPRAVSKSDQLVVILPVRRRRLDGKPAYPSMDQYDTTDGGALDSAVSSYPESLDTNSSFVDSLTDEYSFATTATSLTSIEDTASLDATINLPTLTTTDISNPPRRRAVWDPTYVSPHKGERLRYWTAEGYWVEGVNFKYIPFGGYDYGPPILGVAPRGPCYWDKPIPFQPTPQQAAQMARRAKRKMFLSRLVRPWTWIGDRWKFPPEGSTRS